MENVMNQRNYPGLWFDNLVSKVFKAYGANEVPGSDSSAGKDIGTVAKAILNTKEHYVFVHMTGLDDQKKLHPIEIGKSVGLTKAGVSLVARGACIKLLSYKALFHPAPGKRDLEQRLEIENDSRLVSALGDKAYSYLVSNLSGVESNNGCTGTTSWVLRLLRNAYAVKDFTQNKAACYELPIDSIGLSQNIVNAFSSKGIKTLGDVPNYSAKEIFGYRKQTIEEARQKIGDFGIYFKGEKEGKAEAYK